MQHLLCAQTGEREQNKVQKSCDYPSFTWLCYGGAPRTVWTYSKNTLQNISARTSHFILSRISNALLSLCQHFACLSLTAVEMIWKTFSLWASAGRFQHRNSLSLADDLTVGEGLSPNPLLHARRAEQRHVRSKSIDRPSALECKVKKW